MSDHPNPAGAHAQQAVADPGEQSIDDLLAYVPIWLNATEQRRALMLTKNFDEIPQRITRASRDESLEPKQAVAEI